ncbi:MAG: DUF512 domain-containing protein [Anaerolineae bacterium]|nr:DUF512 domain-containing protein [Thermoflexales bacterium]MDW8408014.1 DUF512 domain-containing protein [Anaerolineae bacterium]
MAGIIQSIEPSSVAAAAGLRPGDALLAINGHALRDVIDAQFYGAEEHLELTFERAGATQTVHVRREFGQSLGIAFEHPTFDIDIRRCNNLCPFCFVLQNAPRMRRSLYIKDDDYRYSFLFGHFVTLTNLSQEDWDRLAEQRLSPLYVSVHATDIEIRRLCLRNPHAPDVLAQLRWLAAHGIQTHTQLVITPGLNDGACLEKSVFDLAALFPHVQSVSVVPVGLTRHHKYGHRTHTPHECAEMIEQVHRWQAVLRAQLGVRFVYATDEWYLVAQKPLPRKRDYDGLALQENGLGMTRDFLDEWRRLKRSEIRRPIWNGTFKVPRRSSAILATGTLFAPTLRQVAREFTRLTGVALEVVAIRNTRLGETITVAGLLMGQDVIEQLSEAARQTELVILPRIMFDHPDGVSLDDVSPTEIARALGRPVALADWMGDVLDALGGRNQLTFEPETSPNETVIVRAGGWAVEKYL